MKKLATGALCILICILMISSQLGFAAEFRFSPHPNKANLINWRHWGKDAFLEAKKAGKPVLLSLSAIWCHWCHEMDETTYSDATVIDYINKGFIPIRVDADRNPDVDSLYNQGGWPSTVILTPDGEVVRGETYVPAGGMVSWLKGAADAYAKGGKEKAKAPVRKEEKTANAEAGSPSIADVMAVIESAYDDKYGGFGVPQKFPNPDAVDFLLAEYVNTRSAKIGGMINTTLANMARGGIYDGVEGGFFRYATLRDWSVPHYEKMLDINAGLIQNYANAYLIFGKGEYLRTLEGTIGYLKKSLIDGKTGAFYGSQDADEEYYKSADRKDAKPPSVDRTVYAGSNAQTISALVAAYGATGKGEYLKMAERAAGFILKKMYSKSRGVYHYYVDGDKHLDGQLADNALFGIALLDLHNATGKAGYMKTVEEIARLLAGQYFDKEHGRFRQSVLVKTVSPSSPGMLMDYNDTVANYRALVFMARFARANGDANIKRVADSVIAGSGGSYDTFKPAAGIFGIALEWALGSPVEITVVTDGGADDFLARINRVYVPQKVVRVLSIKKDKARIDELGYPPERAVYLCSGHKCSPPITRADGLAEGIRKFMEQ